MPLVRVLLFTTLVLIPSLLSPRSCWAAKTSKVELGQELPGTSPEPDETDSAKVERETVDIASPPARDPRLRETEYFYPYRNALSLRLGQAMRSQTYIENTASNPTVSGVQYFFITKKLLHLEVGADLYSDGTGSLQLAKRWVFSRSKLRPYAKGGVGLVVVPQDQLAAFAKFTQYYAMGAGGAEYLVYKSQSVRAEVEAGISMKAIQTALTIGYVWAW